MQATRRRDTPKELAIRRVLFARGLRYRVDTPPLPHLRRRADLVFRGVSVAVYVHGCFWHRCPKHGTLPKTNSDWWVAKLEANRQRDLDTRERLESAGWAVVEIWEHEDAEQAADRIARLVAVRTGQPDQAT